MPDGWDLWEPEWSKAACAIRTDSAGGVRMDAPGRPWAVGGLRQRLGGIRGGQTYQFRARCRLEDLDWPLQSVMMRVIWLTDREP